MPTLAAPPLAADPIDYLFDVGGAVCACAKAMTDTGPPALSDEQRRQWELVCGQGAALLNRAGRAVIETDYTPRATVGEVQARVQEYVSAAMNVLRVAVRNCTSPPWSVFSYDVNGPIPPQPDEWRAQAARALESAGYDLKLVRAPARTQAEQDQMPPNNPKARELVQWCESALALPDGMNILEGSGARVDRSASPTVLRLWRRATDIQKGLKWRCPAPPERPGRPEDFGRAVAALKEWARSIGEAPQSVIVSLGGRRYRVGDHPALTLTENEDTVLLAFLEAPGNTLDKPALIDATGLENAAVILGGLKRKYGGTFAPAIRRPGKRGQGGYHAAVTSASDANAGG
jgi:hypothetical protein